MENEIPLGDGILDFFKENSKNFVADTHADDSVQNNDEKPLQQAENIRISIDAKFPSLSSDDRAIIYVAKYLVEQARISGY